MAKKNINDDNASFRDQRDLLKEINNELGKHIDTIHDVRKQYSSLTNITKILQNDEENITKLTDKQLKSIKTRAEVNLREIKTASQRLTYETASTNAEIALLIAKEDGFKIETKLLDSINKRLIQEKKINSTLGVTGALLKGVSKIPFLGNFIDVDKALDSARKKIIDGGHKFSAMGAAVKSVGEDIIKFLEDPLVLVVGAVKELWDLLTLGDKATGNLSKGLNISYEDAVKLRTQFVDIKNSSDSIYITIQGLQDSLLAINASLGTSAKLINEQDLVAFTKLRDQAGYTNDELVSIQKLTLATGGTLEQNVKNFAGIVSKLNLQNKLTINEKQLLKDISKVSDSIKLSVGGTADKIAEAAFKAKQFGIDLDQANKISEGLLNFEDSISNTISAELLTGKQLNFEKARLLALNGDIAGASADILKQVGGTAEFSKMNRIQQEALAKSIGLSRDELAKSLIDREALQKIGAKDADAAQTKFDNLVKQHGIQYAINNLGDEAYAKQLAQNSIADNFSKLIQNAKEAFIPIANELLPIISNFLQNKVLPFVEQLRQHFGIIKTVVEVIAAVIGVRIIAGLAGMIGSLVTATVKATALVGEYAAMAAAWAIANPVAALAGIGIAAGVGALVYSQIKDGMIDPKGGLVVSGEKGTYKLDPNDHVIAGTNLKPTKTQNTTATNIDITPIVNELSNVKAILAKILDKEGNVYMDSTKTGTSTNVGTYKVQ